MKDEIIKEWFNAWFTPSWDAFEKIFCEDIEYSESWGPRYHGITEIKQWFHDWHLHSTLLEWEIKQILHCKDTTIVEWYFHCVNETEEAAFDGVSLLTWKGSAIACLKEFASVLPKYDPITQK